MVGVAFFLGAVFLAPFLGEPTERKTSKGWSVSEYHIEASQTSSSESAWCHHRERRLLVSTRKRDKMMCHDEDD